MNRCKQARAVVDLLEKNDAQDYLNDLEEFWECWLTHDDNATASAGERKEKLFRYKAAKQFLNSLTQLQGITCAD